MVAYHGTRKKETQDMILELGFRRGTYFAFDIRDAIAYGGDFVFCVELDDDPEKWKGEPDGWQFHLRDPLGPEVIKWYPISREP